MHHDKGSSLLPTFPQATPESIADIIDVWLNYIRRERIISFFLSLRCRDIRRKMVAEQERMMSGIDSRQVGARGKLSACACYQRNTQHKVLADLMGPSISNCHMGGLLVGS